jgi:hypothetical protein
METTELVEGMKERVLMEVDYPREAPHEPLNRQLPESKKGVQKSPVG